MNPKKEAILRQGLRQQDREHAALDPDFVSIEERSEDDLIAFADQYASYLQFYGAGNVPVGDWSRLFEAGVEDIVAYVKNPAQFAVDPDADPAVQQAQRKKLALLTKPHLALFLSFLRIVQSPKAQFDQLTQRHLDFYYQNVLQLKKDPGEPDQVHVVLKAVSNVDEVPVHKGARLNAGNDSQGNPQYYALTEEIMVNQASVGSLKTLCITEKKVGLDEKHWQYEDGFEVILRWTLGQYYQGDNLPPYPDGKYWDEPVDLDFLLNLYDKIKQDALNEQESEEANNYILYQLHFLQVEEFYYCLDTYNRQQEGEDFPTAEEWEQVYRYLDQAYLNKLRQDRMEDLRRERETNGFDSMFKLALGMPQPGDDLPPMPSVDDTFETLYTDLVQDKPNSDLFLLAARYVSQSLSLSTTDFETIMDVKLRSETGQASDEEWNQVYALLVQAEVRKRNPTIEIAQQDIRSLKVVSVAEGRPGQVLAIEQFSPFGQSDTTVTDAQIDLSPYYNPGLAVSSPLLRLETGKRTIKIDVACKAQDFPLTELTQLQNQHKLLFKIYLSGPVQWLILDSLQDSEVVVEVDMIGQDMIRQYQSTQLTMLCTLQGLSGTTITTKDYLLLDDGFQSYLGLWQVVNARMKAGKWQLSIQYCTRLLNEWQRQLIKPGDSGGIEFSSIPEKTDLSQATIDEAKQEIVTPNDGITYFELDDVGTFIVWNDGCLFKITQILEIYCVAVEYLGRLPNYHSSEVPQKYGQIDFKNATSMPEPVKIVGVSAQSGVEDLYFGQDDQDNLLIVSDGLRLKITDLINEGDEADQQEQSGVTEENLRFQRARIEVLDPLEQEPMVFNGFEPAVIKQYIAYPGFRFTINLNEQHPAVLPPGANITPPGLDASQPCVQICLEHRQIFVGDGNVVDLPYEYFKEVYLHNLTLQVKVTNITDLKLRNDTSTINPKTPFEPFGSSPTAGSALYFTSSELSQKQLDTLDMFLQWIDLPDDFEVNYAAYTQSGLAGVPTHLDEDSFNLQLALLNSGAWLDIEQPKPMFKANREGIYETQYQSGFDTLAYRTLSNPDDTNSNDPFDYSRYFRLELLDPDFQHKNYSLVVTQNANSGSDLIVYEPYTPNLRQFVVSYTVSAEIDPYASAYQNNPHRLAHVHPFGCLDLMYSLNPREVADIPMLPQFDEDGDLFMGLYNAKPGQILNLFFQTVSGSGKTSIGWPVPRYFYRTISGWQQFAPADILSDSTQGFVYSGILQLQLPADATNSGPLMPPCMHWIRISADRNAEAASDLIDVRTQGALAEFVVQQSVAPLGQPLPENSITGLVENNPQIQSVTQPYSSFGGRLPENDSVFYTRISERLGHRGRALSLRDYEKMALERFTEIYNAKCLCYTENPDKTHPGQVTLVVIPDVSKVTPFLPLTPKMPLSTLNDIQSYLKPMASLFSRISVVNPFYQQIMYRVAIRFYEGYGEGYYAKQANEDIQRFLSPWAFDNEADIAFGGVIYRSSLIYFLEKLYYVDYVALVSVFEQEKGAADDELAYELIPDGTARAYRPDAVLCSAPKHIIDVIPNESFQEEDFSGIGYMIIGLDFISY